MVELRGLLEAESGWSGDGIGVDSDSFGSRVGRDQRVVARRQRAYGFRDDGQGLAKRGQAVVVDGEDGEPAERLRR